KSRSGCHLPTDRYPHSRQQHRPCHEIGHPSSVGRRVERIPGNPLEDLRALLLCVSRLVHIDRTYDTLIRPSRGSRIEVSLWLFGSHGSLAAGLAARPDDRYRTLGVVAFLAEPVT